MNASRSRIDFGRVLTALEGRGCKAVKTNVQDEWSL